ELVLLLLVEELLTGESPDSGRFKDRRMDSMNDIYLDHNATTPLLPTVVVAMLPCLRDGFGNPSSVHAPGRAARVRLDEAREQVAALIGAHPAEIVFTSGGTEADAMAVLGVARSLKEKGRHIVTSQVEHPAVLNPCRQLAKEGFRVDFLPVDTSGRVDVDKVQAALCGETILIAIQHANSEMGALQPIEEIGSLARDRGVLFHTDAVQAVGKIPVNVQKCPVDLMAVSAHKMSGPKGVGALFIRRGTPPLSPLIEGGGQEKKRRGGTENVPGIVGFGQAAAWAANGMMENMEHLAALKSQLIEGIRKQIPQAIFHGNPEYSLPNTVSVGFTGVDGEALMIRLDLAGVSVSTGTACSSGVALPSDVLAAMQAPPEVIRSTIRISLGHSNTADEITRVLAILTKSVQDIRRKAGVAS
ncbi:MAG: cysteine desulfurase family protein, partial [Nitrospinaceae bacterium]